jgi:hypothetical protein
MNEIYARGISLLRYAGRVTLVTFALVMLIEVGTWLLFPARYASPPAVTADVWMHSDALSPGDRLWLNEFVEEFCDSYNAHWTPYVYFRRNPFTGKHINVDSNSIRRTAQFALSDRETVRPRRIFLLGGSTMWGTGARDSGTIPSALSGLIAADPAFGPAEVVNLGESGYVSTQSLIRLTLELRNGNIPDLVILFDGVNDVVSAYQNGAPGTPQNEVHRTTEFNLLKDRERMSSLWLDSLLSRTLTGELARRIRTAFSPEPPLPPARLDLAEGVLRVYRRNLELIEALSKHFSFHYEAYWQPVALVKSDLTPYERQQADLVAYVLPLFKEVYRKAGVDPLLCRNPRFHNISTIFDSVRVPVYLDFCHVTETGNAVIARRMYSDIKRY